MRRPGSRPVSVTRRSTGDTAQIIVRAGDKELGAITQLGSDGTDTLSGNFTNRPAFADVAAVFNELAKAVAANDAVTVNERRAEIAKLGIEVWHSVHDMRIDEAGSLAIAGGKASFRPNGAFQMMRTGGI
ncbi:MAG: hypothetical protein ACKVP7_04855 [Hyphomicrobiaceae bacterium]